MREGSPTVPSVEPPDLGEAWERVEAALPAGWRIHFLEATVSNEWRAVAGVRHDDGTDPFIAIEEGKTPAAAMSALAAKLEARSDAT